MKARNALLILALAAGGALAGRALAARDEIKVDGWVLFWANLVDQWLFRGDDLKRIEAKIDLLLAGHTKSPQPDTMLGGLSAA